jgi:hypothetical protein
VQSAVKSPGSQISAGPSLLEKCWRRFVGFLFPPESDVWLAVLRIGLGLQVIVYALFLRSDWHYLFASGGKGLVGREVGEAITTFDSLLIPKLSWLIAVGRYYRCICALFTSSAAWQNFLATAGGTALIFGAR